MIAQTVMITLDEDEVSFLENKGMIEDCLNKEQITAAIHELIASKEN